MGAEGWYGLRWNRSSAPELAAGSSSDEERRESRGGEVGELQRGGGEEAAARLGDGGGEQLLRCRQQRGLGAVAAEKGGGEIFGRAAVEARLRRGSE